jgi:hypothetical protein
MESTPPNLLLPDKLWRFVWREPAGIEPHFVWALFQTRNLRWAIGRRATGTSGSMKNISREKVFGIRTILPTVAPQIEFARQLAAAENLITTHRESLAELTRSLPPSSTVPFAGNSEHAISQRHRRVIPQPSPSGSAIKPSFDDSAIERNTTCGSKNTLTPSLTPRERENRSPLRHHEIMPECRGVFSVNDPAAPMTGKTPKFAEDVLSGSLSLGEKVRVRASLYPHHPGDLSRN